MASWLAWYSKFNFKFIALFLVCLPHSAYKTHHQTALRDQAADRLELAIYLYSDVFNNKQNAHESLFYENNKKKIGHSSPLS